MSAITTEMRERAETAVSEAMGDAYDCLRVWSAWSYGTMGPDDFALVAEDGDRVAEIAGAVISVVEPVVQRRDDLLAELRHAHTIIRNALQIMTTEQKRKWGDLNELAGIPGEGVTRAHEREAVIKNAEGRS